AIRVICRGSPFQALNTAASTRRARETASSITNSSLTLAGVTFAAISLLVTQGQNLSAGTNLTTRHQTPVGFLVLALVIYATSVILAKWIRPWTVYVLEQVRDVGTVLLLVAVGFLIFDLPGTGAWD